MSVTAVVDGRPATWTDRKRYLWLLGIVVPMLPYFAADGARDTGSSVYWWLGPIVVYLVIPLLDAVLPEDRANAPDWAVEALDGDRYYRWITFLFLPLQYAGLVYATHIVATTDLSLVDTIGYALTVGTVAGIAINTAHELGHKKEKVERRLSRIALAQSLYGHFCVEHNRGHHNRVATPEDPASSRLGESFWAFLPRTVVGSVRSAWELEAKRLRARGQSVVSIHNEVLTGWAMSVVLYGVLIGVFGLKVAPFLLGQAVFGFTMLEVVNYVEHYGLLRQTTASGRYERCNPEHSWNSNHVASNLFLYNLERHSDHHAHPTRRYQVLRHFEESPQLPNGYGLMIGLAYVPPLWRAVMDRRVLAHYEGDVTRANIHPPKRERILTKYGAR